MHEVALLQDLAVVLLIAGLVTVVFHRLRQPVVLGYILAGIIIGPHTPPAVLIREPASISTLSELGVILLMFSLGLHFSLRKLVSVGATAFLAASLEILIMGIAGYEVGRMFGWNFMDSIFLGAILSISSTTIIIKALQELGLTKEHFAELIFGILIVEDILAIAMLALLSGLAISGSPSMRDVGWTLGRLGMFLTVVLVLGLLLVPPTLRYLVRFKSNEMLVVFALGMCFGVALLAAKFGYSVALGAFLIGAIMAEAREKGQIEHLIEPVRDVFSAIFFVAIGMLIDPRLLLEHAVPIVVVTIVVVVGKIIACTGGTFLAGHDMRTSLRVGMGVSQIGEFSFIIAQLGLTLKVTSGFLYPIAVMVSAITTLLTPYLIRSSDPLAGLFDRYAPRRLVTMLDLYTAWITRLSTARGGNRQVRRLLQKWLLQIALNMILVTAMLLATVPLGGWIDSMDGQRVPGWLGGPRTAVWLGAMIFPCLPLLIASLRKLRALAMFAAEAGVARAGTREQTNVLRAIIVNVVLILGTGAIIGWVLVLSSTVLPPWPGVAVLAGVLVLVALVLWRAMVKVYGKAQIALVETFTAEVEKDTAITAAVAPLTAMLETARLEVVDVGSNSPAAGKLIRELALRTRTGASIVGIQRPSGSVVNPGPDEEIKPEDRLLLLGVGDQLANARQALASAPT